MPDSWNIQMNGLSIRPGIGGGGAAMGAIDPVGGDGRTIAVGASAANDDVVALRGRIERLEADLAVEAMRREATEVLCGALIDEAAAHPDRAGHPLANDQDRVDEVFAYALRQAARRRGCSLLLYGTTTDHERARNRERMERESAMRAARLRIVEIEQEIVDLESAALELRERIWRDGLLPIRRAGFLWLKRTFRGTAYPDRAHAETARDRHLAYLEDKRQACLRKADLLRREIRRQEAVARGWTPVR
jgi:hypothetical protein